MSNILPFPVKKEILFRDKKIVLLQKPPKAIYNRNVFCLNKQGELIWQIEEILNMPGGNKNCPYVNIEIKDNVLIAWNWCSFYLLIDLDSGNVLGMEETR